MLGAVQDPDIRLLRIFHAIVECGGFSRAQVKLNLSQSAISTHMSQLESRLGTRLCERGHGVFELTEDGQAVFDASEKLFSALKIFRTEVADAQDRLIGELSIGLIDNSVTHPDTRVQTAIRRFTERAPDVRVQVYVGGAIELEERVMDGRLHLAIGLFHHRVPSLEYTRLFEENHLLYCGADHKLFDYDDADLTPEIITRSNYVSWDYVESLPGWEAPFPFHDVASSPYIEGIAFMILSGAYVAYLPTHYARHWTDQGQMRALLPETTRRTASFHLITSRPSRQLKLTRAFLRELNKS